MVGGELCSGVPEFGEAVDKEAQLAGAAGDIVQADSVGISILVCEHGSSL